MSARGGYHGGGGGGGARSHGSKREAPSPAQEASGAAQRGGEAKRGRGPPRHAGSGAPTVRDLITDTLAPLANAYWAPGAAQHAPFDPQIIESIYSKHLAPANDKTTARLQREEERKGGQAAEEDENETRRLAAEEEAEQTSLEHQRAQRLLLLELSAYLENYLWKHYSPATATFAHVMSFVMLINQKFKGENRVGIWDPFRERAEDLVALLERISRIKTERDLTLLEANQLLVFFIHSFESFEEPAVRRVFMRLCSVDSWRCLRETSILRALRSNADNAAAENDLRSVWPRIAAKPASDFAATFLPNLLSEFVHILYSLDEKSPLFHLQAAAAGRAPRKLPYALRDHVLYLERFLEFLVGLLAKLSTRRWAKKLLEEAHLLVLCQQAPLVIKTRAREAELAAQQAALAERGASAAGSDAMDLEVLAASTATSGGAILSLDNHSNTNAAAVGSASALPGRLFCQLLDILQRFLHFEVDDVTGQQLEAQEALNRHFLDVQILQKVCFKFFSHVPQLHALALANVSRIDDADTLAEMLQGLTQEQLKQLCVAMQLLPRDEEVEQYKQQAAAASAPPSKKKGAAAAPAPTHVPRLIVSLLPYMQSSPFLLRLLQSHFVLRPSTLATIQAMPLYPPESLLFDEHAIPSTNYTGDTVLALPKLNLQFLTLHDYLQRNFQLYKGESTYEIREDIAYTLKRLKPRVGNDGSTLFTGWARMACPLVSFAVTGVAKPLIGESKPSSVKAEITIDLAVFQGVVRDEWENLRQHDVLFLLAVQALTPVTQGASAAGAAALARQQADNYDRFKGRKKVDMDALDLDTGVAPEEEFHALQGEPLLVRFVRGCCVKAVLDGTKKIIGERDDKGNVYKARGSVRTFRVELDTAQYLLDQRAEVAGRSLDGGSPVSAVYSSFNLLLRRKPKENNFRSVLETVRDLMTDTATGVASLPTWLQQVFLGYGKPTEAQYYSLPQQLPTLEFIDTFVDLQHLRDSFHESVDVAERSSDDIAAELQQQDQASSLSLVAVGGEANNRQTAANTAIQLTRQVMRLVATAQREKASKASGGAAAGESAAVAASVDTSSSTFRVTFPLHVAPNYEVLQQLLYARGAGVHSDTHASGSNLLAEGAETLKSERRALAKRKLLRQDDETEEGEVEEGEVDDEEPAGEAAAEEEPADAAMEEGDDAAPEPAAPAAFEQTEPVFELTEPVKPAVAAASGEAAAPAAAAAGVDVEAQVAALSSLTVPKLKEQLKERGLPLDGLKAVLLERLSTAIREAGAAAPTPAAADAAPTASASSAEAEAAYEKELATYKAGKTAHEKALAEFRAAEQAHKAAVAAHEAQQGKKEVGSKKASKKSPKKKSPAKGKKAAAAAEEEEPPAADTEITDAAESAAVGGKKKRGSHGKKQEAAAAEAAVAAAAAPATAAAAAVPLIPPSPHTLSVELLPRVHARHDYVRRNLVRFTPIQVEAIKSGLNPGLTMIVGPPGTGKTDTAVQIISELYHNFPEQRTLLITHSNSALNDLFEKIMTRDIDERYLLRLGRGSEEIAGESDMGRFGRVNFMLQRRLTLLDEVAALARSLHMSDDVAYTCETSGHFFLAHVLSRWEKFVRDVQQGERTGAQAELQSFVSQHFPFTAYFQQRSDKQQKIWAQYYAQQAVAAAPSTDGAEAMEVDGTAVAASATAAAPQVPTASLFRGSSLTEDMSIAVSCFADLQQTFVELEETRPFELLRTYKDRSNYLLSKHAKIIAMTCTHAAIKRADLVALNFRFDNIVMEESAQILEIETFIPFLLQRTDDTEKDGSAGSSKSSGNAGNRLKRIIMLGDHNQLPPVIKNRSLQRYSRLDQSLFTRFIRLGMPYVQLNAQGRMRSSLAALWNWQYRDLGNLPSIQQHPSYIYGNVGFAHEYQLINVEDLNGVGESSPTPFFYQNLAEAEYVVQTYMYMRLLGYPASRISILTTYNGQKHLIRDILQQRCANNLLFGLPAKVQTVDKFQGQQNDFILLSLVRTRTVGHLRDVRRLVVAMSRARLGLYIFARMQLYTNAFELTRTFNQLLHKPVKLQLLPQEKRPMDQPLQTERLAAGVQLPPGLPQPSAAALPPAVLEVRDVVHMGELVGSMTLSVQSEYSEYQRRIFAAQEAERMAHEQRMAAQRQYEEAREATRREDARLAALAARDAEHAQENERLQRELGDDSAAAADAAPSADRIGASPDSSDSDNDDA